MDLTGHFLEFPRCEVLIYLPLPFVVRFLSREGQDRALTALFGTEQWRDAIPLAGQERVTFLHDLFRDRLRASGCTYVRSFEIQSDARHGYHLFFGTTSLRGLEKMKDAMWSLDPLGGQLFGDSTDNAQMVLFSQTVDTGPLLAALKDHFGNDVFSIEAADEFTLTGTPYAKSHLRSRTLAPAERRGELEATGRNRACSYPDGTKLRFLP